MKRLFVKTVLALIFSMFLSSPSYAEWTKVIGYSSALIYYVDFDRIREHNGYVYHWQLDDVPKKPGSYMAYQQVDCALMRYKTLSFTEYNDPMGGGGAVDSVTYSDDEVKWNYLPPGSPGEIISTAVCDSVR